LSRVIGGEAGDVSDAELVQQAQHNRAAFGALYERYVDRIYSYLYYRTASPADAEDLTARTFTRALSSLGDFEERGLPFSAWLFTIAHNLMANYHRDRSRRPTAPLEGAPEPAAPSPYQATEEADAAQQAIATLPPERQHLILLKYGQGMSNAEIGRVLGKSEGAVKSLLRRTLAALRRELERSQEL
jgi:RNA polymerase sigma-70 factor, ECF subfamily